MKAAAGLFALEASLVGALGVACAGLFWAIAAPTPPAVMASAPGVSAGMRTEEPARDYQALMRVDAFRLNVTAAPVAVVVEEAPETGLNLAVTGLRALGGGGGSAFIRLPDGSQRVFRVDDEILPGVSLLEVRNDRVLLLRDGVVESLVAAGEASRGTVVRAVGAPPLEPPAPTASAPSASSQAAPDAPVQIDASGLSAEMLFAGIEVRPVRNGSVVTGYRVFARGDGTTFNAVGLQAGDTLVRINDQDASDLESLAAAFDDPRAQERLTLVVERDGGVRELEIEFE